MLPLGALMTILKGYLGYIYLEKKLALIPLSKNISKNCAIEELMLG